MENSMYRRLLMLPIFNGLTTGELTQIIAQIHLDFNQHSDGETIVSQDDRCDRLIYVLSGQVECEYRDPENRFTLSELMGQPFLLEPSKLYGMSQRYDHSYTTLEPVDTVTISKRDFNNVMLNYSIVKTNILNMLCARIQHLTKLTREAEPDTVQKKLVQFLRRHVYTPKGQKTLYINMETLAMLIQETRLNVSFALRNLNQQGLIDQPRRGQILIPDMQTLIIHNA